VQPSIREQRLYTIHREIDSKKDDMNGTPRPWKQNRRGQGTVEYGLILILVAVGAMLATDKIGVDVSSAFHRIAAKVGLAAGS
jgi:Flp pilus assembly pilin Flp